MICCNKRKTAVESEFNFYTLWPRMNHGYNNVSSAIPGGLGPIRVLKFPRAPQTSAVWPERAFAVERTDRRYSQTAKSAFEG